MIKNVLRKVHLFILCTIVASLMTACSGAGAKSIYEYKMPADIGDGWKTAALQDYDVDIQKIAAMMQDIQDGGFESLHSLLIVKDGRLVFEEYFQGYNQNRMQGIASVTKSVTSILIGIAIDQGLIRGTDQYLTELLPAYRELLNADPLKQKLQLWHILTMTSGLEWDEDTYPYGDARNDATAMERSPNPVRFVLDRPVVREPGKQFQYCGGNTMLLSAILEEATGMTAADFAKEYLFTPLDISPYQWGAYADGHTNTDGGLYMRPRDMAKIGQLMLNGGYWNGVRIISAEWVAESTRARTKATLIARYGYQWWRDSQAVLLETVDSYFAAGFGGQTISVYPGQNMVVIFTNDLANNDENSFRIMFLRSIYILPATVTAVWSKILLWSWLVLTMAGLAFLTREIIRGQILGLGRGLSWLLIGAAFGPLGMAAYLLSYRNQRTRRAIGWRALGMAVLLALGNITGLILVTVFQALFYPDISAVLLVIPAAFLVSWLVFIAPLASVTNGIRYGKAIWRTKLTAFITACFALAGTFPVLILLTIRWFLFGVDLTSPLSWVMVIACGMAGAVMVYPFSLWLVYRNPELWVVPLSEAQSESPAGSDRRLPGFRNAWGAFLLGLICLIAGFGITVKILH